MMIGPRRRDENAAKCEGVGDVVRSSCDLGLVCVDAGAYVYLDLRALRYGRCPLWAVAWTCGE